MHPSDNQSLNAELAQLVITMTAHYRRFIIELVALDTASARKQLSTFSYLLTAYIAFYQQQLQPALATANNDDHDNSVAQTDYLILGRSLDRVELSLKRVEQSERDVRREILVDELDAIVRLQNVLRLHGERCDESLYPVINQKINQGDAQLLIEQLQQTIHLG